MRGELGIVNMTRADKKVGGGGGALCALLLLDTCSRAPLFQANRVLTG